MDENHIGCKPPAVGVKAFCADHLYPRRGVQEHPATQSGNPRRATFDVPVYPVQRKRS
ncbi:hypothetical protein HMPREF0294_0080 [Corynebacterium glucuronolyticum ATCC 51867]|nr:hypothetical protein HMPREF0294_0080 [Corynebacterium glucuronolyticum ATCC 51867]